MFNSHTKVEVFTITSNKEMKGNAKCKSSHFESPFGGLRHNAQGSSMARWKAHCQLPISNNWTSSLALAAVALLSKICQNQHGSFVRSFRYWSKLWCSKAGWVTLSTNIRVKGVVHQRLLASKS